MYNGGFLTTAATEFSPTLSLRCVLVSLPCSQSLRLTSRYSQGANGRNFISLCAAFLIIHTTNMYAQYTKLLGICSRDPSQDTPGLSVPFPPHLPHMHVADLSLFFKSQLL